MAWAYLLANANPGAGMDDGWTLGAGANKQAAVQANDGDTSYIYDTGSSNTQTFLMDDLPSYAKLVIGEPIVVLTARYFSGTSRNIKGRLKFPSAASADATAQAMTNSYASYAFTPGRPGGGSWSVADVNNVGAGCINGTGDADGRVTMIQMQVEYKTGGGNMAYLMAEFLGPVLGAALTLRDLARVRLELARVTKSKLVPTEAELREFLAHLGRPRILDLGAGTLKGA